MSIKRNTLSLLVAVFAALSLGAQERALTAPPAKFGMDLGTALESRRSLRQFAGGEIPAKDLSTILWSAAGVNWRKEGAASINKADTLSGATAGGRRTIVTAFGVDYVKTYVLLSDGAWRYDPARQVLVKVSAKDVRAAATLQNFPGRSAVIVFVADGEALAAMPAPPNVTAETRLAWAYATAGLAAQNVYLASGALGYGALLVAFVNEDATRPALGLGEKDRIMLAMPLGTVK